MSSILLVESNNVGNKLINFVPDKIEILPLQELFNCKSLCDLILLRENNMSQELEMIKKTISQKDDIYIAYSDDAQLEFLINYAIDYFNIKRFFKVDLEKFTLDSIQKSFNEAIMITGPLIDKNIAEFRIKCIVECKISELVKWFFKKEKVFNDELLKRIQISRELIHLLSIIVPIEDRIENFNPEIYQKVGIDYSVDGKQFRVKNANKYKPGMEDELSLFIGIVSDSNNSKIITKYQRDTVELAPKKPFNTIDLQKACSMQFALEPREVLESAKRLFNGVLIFKDKEPISLISNHSTKSRKVPNEIINEILPCIKKEFGEDYIPHNIRNYGSEENETLVNKTAIYPLYFEEKYYPENLYGKLESTDLKVYTMIWERTLSAFMTNALIDATELLVNCVGNKFKAMSNIILKEGWLKFGLFWEDTELYGQDIEIPESLYLGQELKNDVFMGVVSYNVKERRPMRYGTGRLIEKLNKELNITTNEVAIFVDYLKKQEFIEIYKTMIHPSSFSRKIFYFFETYLSEIYSTEFINETNDMLEKIEKGKLNKNLLIDKYQDLVLELKKALGYENKSLTPDETLIKRANRIAIQKNQVLTDFVLSNKRLLQEYVLKNDDKIERIGFCPICKQAEVYEHSKGFSCSSSECNFVIWNNTIKKFFDKYQKTINQETYKEYIRVILKKEKCLIRDLYNSKNENFFDANIKLELNSYINSWVLSFDIAKKASYDFSHKQNNDSLEQKKK